MRILVGVASRHGSTQEIAARIADRLRERGHDIDLVDVTHASREPVERYDAYVVGSAVYEGRWLRGARRFVLDNAVAMQHALVWLFSSGPLDRSGNIGVDEHRLDELSRAVDARDHHEFTGRLDRAELGPVEGWIVDAVRAYDGDFRDWPDVDAWATSIADALDAHANPRSAVR